LHLVGQHSQLFQHNFDGVKCCCYNRQHNSTQNIKTSLHYWNRHNTLHVFIQCWHKAKIKTIGIPIQSVGHVR